MHYKTVFDQYGSFLRDQVIYDDTIDKSMYFSRGIMGQRARTLNSKIRSSYFDFLSAKKSGRGKSYKGKRTERS